MRGAWSLSEAVQEKVDTEGQCYVDTDDAKPCLVNVPRRHRVTAATFTARDRYLAVYNELLLQCALLPDPFPSTSSEPHRGI